MALTTSRHHAIVLGGSMAGLLTARVLSKHFDRVTIVERDPVSDQSSLRRHYEKLARFPKGFLVLGDAICSFNPTYGQGMTSAAMQAAELDTLLAQRQAELAPHFFKRAAKVVDSPWQLAVGEDFRFPETTGPKPAGIDLLNRYVAAVHRATLVDSVVGKTFIEVLNLLAPPSRLMTPGMMLRVWRANQRLAQQAGQNRSRPGAAIPQIANEPV